MSRLPALVAVLLLSAAAASAATFTVDTMLDAVDDNPADGLCQTAGGSCSLRAAVQQANATAGKDTIMVPAGTYVLGIAGDGEDAAATGDLDILDAVAIVGAGPGVTIIDANQLDRIFDLLSDNGQGVELTGLTLRNGAPGVAFPYGGAVFNDLEVSLTMTDVALTGCTAAHGGAVYNEIGGILVLTRVSVTSNTAGTAGGGLESLGTADLENVTVSANTGPSGIANVGDLMLGNVTLVDDRLVNEGQTTVKNSIFANSPCPASGVSSLGHNLDDGTTCPFGALGDLSNVDPMLGPLQDNGGGTLTYALDAASPAVDAGSGDCPPPSEDQRGAPRPIDGDQDTTAVCDIGAYEYDPSIPPTSTTTTLPGGTTTTTTTTLPPGCSVEPTFASAECRVGELTSRLAQVGTAGKPLNKLTKLLTKAGTKLTVAQEKLALEKMRPARRQVSKARRFVKRFGKKIVSKKGAKAVPDEADRTDLQSGALALETDLTTLADSLR